MKNIKTQFEIRYVPILNFSYLYKEVVSPYLGLTEFTIANSNKIEEYIIFTFVQEGYQIEIRWDRMVLVAEGPREDLKKPRGPFFIFFEILAKIKALPTFNRVLNAILAETNLIAEEGDFESIKERFKKKFYTEAYDVQIDGFSEDFAIHTQLEKEDSIFKLDFGPFDYKKDVSGFNLSPIHKKPIDSFKEMNGIVLSATYYENLKDADSETYKRFNRIIYSTCHNVKL